MNPFQRAREEATKVRCSLLGERAGQPIHSGQLLLLIEEKLRLGIEKVDKNFSELGTGDAVLKRSERYIYVCKDVSEEKHAYLVAHELGHWFLDAAKAPIAISSLSSLAGVEGAPAVVRVEAYGAREREELQANVFARELLFPRDVARNTFLKGIGPSKAAVEMCLPLEAARQQMLDAILLPQITRPASKALRPPSPDQENAAQAKERFVNVVAGPGTGKTSTLIHRVKFLIEKQHVDPSHILVLTFTNKAAFELVERLRVAGIERAADIWAGTFHAFGLEFLRKYHHCFGLDSEIVVADRLNEVTLLNRELPNISLRHYSRVEDPYDWLGGVIQGIKRLKEELVSPAQYRERLSKLKASDELQLCRTDFAMLYEAHEAALRKAGLVDFVDLVALPAQAIIEDRPRYSELADKFQHILVDEYQDVTQAMVELVKQLAHKAKSLWVVGDIRQSIHHWRGASLKSLVRFEQTFRDQAATTKSTIQKYPLKLNRRNSKEILDLVTKVGQIHVLEQDLPLDATRATAGKSGHPPILVSCIPKTSIPTAMASAIRTLKDNGVSFSNQAVLCRRTDDVETAAAQLRREGVPLLYVGDLTRRAEIKRLLCLMQLLVERQPRTLVGLLANPELALPKADLYKILELSKSDVTWQRGRWLERRTTDFSKIAQAALANLSDLLTEQKRHSLAWDFVCDLLLEKRFGLPPTEDLSIDAHTIRIALWQFAYSVRAGDGERKALSLTRFLLRYQLRQRIGETYHERDLPPEALALEAVGIQTVHSSKGLEFDAVHIGYLDEASYGEKAPPWKPDDDITELVPPEVLGSTRSEYEREQAVERNNLLYVAVSRARQHLRLYEDGYWANRNRPRQLLHEPKTFVVEHFAPAHTQKQLAKRQRGLLARDDPLTFDQFETYVRCPLQYWYRYGLGLSREQEADVSVRARFAVMDALRAIASKKPGGPSEALAESWRRHHLPTKEEDRNLWRDAEMLYKRGLEVIKTTGGTYEELVCSVERVAISLPWVLAKTERGSTRLHLLRFSPRGAAAVKTLLRPMLSGLLAKGNFTLFMRSLLSEAVDEVTPSGNAAQTNAVAAANRFSAGDQSPTPGRHCSRCAYLTICPCHPT